MGKVLWWWSSTSNCSVGKKEIGIQKRYFGAWKVHKKDSQDLPPADEKEEAQIVTKPEHQEEEVSYSVQHAYVTLFVSGGRSQMEDCH